MTRHSDAKDDLTPEQRDRLRRALRRVWLTLLAVLPMTAIVLALSHWISPQPAPAPGHHLPPSWMFLSVLAVLLLVVLPVEVWFVSRRFRRPGTARDLLISGEQRDIRRVVKALRRRQPMVKSAGVVCDDRDPVVI